MKINVKTTKQAETKRAPDVNPVSERAPRENAWDKTSPACQCGVQPRGNAATNPVFTDRARTSTIRNPQSAIRNAFTLVELITVIVIIILLTGILLPTIVRAKQLAYIATTKAYITQLETGALRYQQENQYFPYQDGNNIAGYTASQVLISELMGIERTGSGNFGATPPKSPYVEYKEDRVIHTAVDTPENPHDYPLCTPVDLFPTSDAYALLYYPSRLGNDGRVGTAVQNNRPDDGAFRFADNVAYTQNDSATLLAFQTIIWDKRFGVSDADAAAPDANEAIDKAYNADTFLIFGKGMNDRDEADSWFTPNSPKNF